MDINTKKLLEFLKESNDNKVELDKSFFISIIEKLDTITNSIHVDELFSNSRSVTNDGYKTVISKGELLSESSKFHRLTGEVTVDVAELKAILKDNQRYLENIKILKELNVQLEKQIGTMFSNSKLERDLRRIASPYTNSMFQHIKVNLKG